VTDICLHIIGAGRAAQTLAAAWRSADTLSIGLVMNRSLDSAEQAVALIGGGQPCGGLQSFCQALSQQTASRAEHWLLLGTADSSIGEVADALGKCWQDCTQADLPLAWAFHLSGQQGPEVLQGLAAVSPRLQLGAAHPVVSFADPARARQQLADSYCLLATRPVAQQALAALFAQLGMHVIMAPAELDRARYHAALVMVSNFQCALHNIAEQLLTQAGFQSQQSRPLLASLSTTVAANLDYSGSLAALTGPLERGDTAASERLLQACAQLPLEQQQAVQALTAVVLQMASDKGSLTARQLAAMRALLAQLE
jgi:predicted short-subunit dehydrogenase-like oxidoreductase (DUF2520 family)